jgi:hypothetical protein
VDVRRDEGGCLGDRLASQWPSCICHLFSEDMKLVEVTSFHVGDWRLENENGEGGAELSDCVMNLYHKVAYLTMSTYDE